MIELFAFFHDSWRVNEYRDTGHGTRGAELASRVRDQLFEATDQEMILLTEAWQKHSRGTLKADITVQTCFDADRLDLARVGIIPNPRFLCTDEAKHQVMLSAEIKRSTHRY